MLNNILKTNIIIFLIICILTIFFSCKKEDRVPNEYVNFYIYLDDPEYIDLKVPGNYIYVTGGVEGIIIYRLSQDEFVAFDRICTYKPSDRCAVQVDSTNVTAVCPCCGSKFLILDGSVCEPPAEQTLKQYQTSFDGFMLHVYN